MFTSLTMKLTEATAQATHLQSVDVVIIEYEALPPHTQQP
jgi:hypothetical protein